MLIKKYILQFIFFIIFIVSILIFSFTCFPWREINHIRRSLKTLATINFWAVFVILVSKLHHGELFCCEIPIFLKREYFSLSLFPTLRNQKITEKIEKKSVYIEKNIKNNTRNLKCYSKR